MKTLVLFIMVIGQVSVFAQDTDFLKMIIRSKTQIALTEAELINLPENEVKSIQKYRKSKNWNLCTSQPRMLRLAANPCTKYLESFYSNIESVDTKTKNIKNAIVTGLKKTLKEIEGDDNPNSMGMMGVGIIKEIKSIKSKMLCIMPKQKYNDYILQLELARTNLKKAITNLQIMKVKKHLESFKECKNIRTSIVVDPKAEVLCTNRVADQLGSKNSFKIAEKSMRNHIQKVKSIIDPMTDVIREIKEEVQSKRLQIAGCHRVNNDQRNVVKEIKPVKKKKKSSGRSFSPISNKR